MLTAFLGINNFNNTLLNLPWSTDGFWSVSYTHLEETRHLREFKTAGTRGILECEIESLILPLLADHPRFLPDFLLPVFHLSSFSFLSFTLLILPGSSGSIPGKPEHVK